RPHPLFRSGHAQTLAAYLWPRRRSMLARARRDEARLFEVEPGARVLVHCRWQRDAGRAPTLLLVHGLEGSSESTYVLGTAQKAQRAGFNVLRMNLRTCGDTLHLTRTLYHSGLSQDLRAVVEELSGRDGLKEIFLAGFSLGGNQSLKLAGEDGGRVPSSLRGVCAVSPSIDLAACADAIHRRSNWLYSQRFLRSLKRRLRAAAAHYPDIYSAGAAPFIRSIREFDSLVTAPHGGFSDADDYYARSSALQFIGSIRTPALVVQAQDDPFVPFDAFRHPSLSSNPSVVFLAPGRGGHVGFLSDDAAADGGDRFWAESRVVEFCSLLRREAGAGVDFGAGA
ncbi:MAG: alpha/beta fold hydrolase, partial [Acidobacteria bacterium]|nr:alpha/beta fold hydrolase [Acidobacteriota bacterium]